MYRLIGIIIIVLGVLISVLGFTGILPNMGPSGIFLFFTGGLLLGLSFIPRPEAIESEPMSLPESLLKIFYAPAEVFQNLRLHPGFLGVVLLTALISGVYTIAFFERVTPERISNYTVDKIAESGWVQEGQVETIRKETIETNSSPLSRAGQVLNGFSWTIFLAAFLGLVFWLIVMAFGGQINYWQAISATAYAFFPVTLLQKGLSLLILYLKDPSEIHPILGQTTLVQDSLNFLITPASSPVLYTLLSSFSLLAIYSLWLFATGLKNAGENVSATTAWTASVIIWMITLTLGVVSALLLGNFIS